MLDLAEKLIQSRDGRIFWTGHLSDSALATAVASFALHAVDSRRYEREIKSGINWLIANVNPDGGWGDTRVSLSNISTTLLCWSVLNKAGGDCPGQSEAIVDCQSWVIDYCGSLSASDISAAVYSRYNNDRTFSAPIMTVCALGGIWGEGKPAWKYTSRLPFELSIFPQKLYSRLGLPVVSYALPALIAIGQVVHKFNPSRNPILRAIRSLAVGRSLARLKAIQPCNGGFLEAAPLTAFVTLSLAAKGVQNEITEKAVEFLLASQRPDGSWPIDTDLAIWLTSLSVNALTEADKLTDMSLGERTELAQWLISNQNKVVHPYTGSAPGGWGWTDKPGAVPDADDTSGVILALLNLADSGVRCPELIESVICGCRWLMGIQNKDGGVPTFCRGWGRLDFDRSCCDITAHAVSAWGRALAVISDIKLRAGVEQAILRGLEYLRSQQSRDGFWQPLWFGCQYMPDDTNEVYGTARVMSALAEVSEKYYYLARPMLEKAAHGLVSVQLASGGFSGGISKQILESENDIASIEETALAITALQKALDHLPNEKQKKTDSLAAAIDKARAYLEKRWQMSSEDNAAPIGLYFAKLWYYEQLYPLIFSVPALINKSN